MSNIKRAFALVLCAVMLVTTCACGKKEDTQSDSDITAQSAAANTQKSYTDVPSAVSKAETVYVSIDNSGKETGITVTDWIHTDKPQVRVEDKSDLENIRNVKTGAEPLKENDRLVWNMDTTDLYYSGTVNNKTLPVSIDIKYTLDGKEMTAQEIAGKSGHVEIIISFKNNCFKEVTVNGKTQRVYLPLLAAGGTILSESTFSSISVENGLSLGDGTKQVAAVAGAPGLCESLGISADELNEAVGLKLSDTFVISADTTCFEITNLYFAVIPFCSLDLDLVVPDSISGLTKNLDKIRKMFASLEKIDINDIMNILSGNVGSVSELTDTVNEALALYDKNQALLKLGSKYCTDDNLKVLSSLAEVMNDEDFVKGLSVLGSADLDKLAESLPDVAKSLEKLEPLLKDETLSKALEILSSSVMVKFFKQLPALSESLSTVQKLVGNQDFMNAIKTLSDPSVAAVMQKLPGLMDSFDALAPMLGDLQSDLSDPEVQKSIENLPETMKSLNKLLGTVEKNSDAIKKLVDFASDDDVKQLIDILSESDIDVNKLSNKLSSVIDNADETAACAKCWMEFGNEYGLFTQSVDNQQTSVIFIYNTPAVEKPAQKEVQTVKEETHWYDRILDLFKKE